MHYSDENGADLLTPIVDKQDKQSLQGSCIMLPPELLSSVCGFLPKQVLKQLRQVSKTCERAAVPYLFNEIFISQNMADLRIAKLVILQFRPYIRTLVLSSVYYTDMDRESFDEKKLEEESGINHDNYTCPFPDHAFAIYRIARRNQQESLRNGAISAYLSFALTSSPKIQKIVLTDTSSSRSMSRKSLQVYEPRSSKACPNKDCDLGDTDRLPYAVRQSGFSRKGSTNPWRLALSALYATNANVKELTMEPRDMELGTNTAAFSMSPGSLGQAELCFHNLTKLRFSLTMDDKPFSTNVDTRHVHRNVAKLLRSAINLESLSLLLLDDYSIPNDELFTLQEILGRCEFPKLRSLILPGFVSSEAELLRFLRPSKNLEYLTINCHILSEGTWMRVADWIRASLPLLKHAGLEQLYGGFDEPWASIEYMDFYENVGKFFFAQGENPFTTKALDQYHADIKAKRRKIDPSGGIGFIEAYRKYH